MSKSSINFQTAKSNSSAHMSRDSFVSYLIEHDNNHFEYKHYQDPKEYLEFALVQTKLLTNRKMQSKAIENFTQEAVLNIKKDTTIAEVENLFKTYNKEFKGGFKVFEMALHKDEGVFIDTKHNVDDLVFDSKTLRIYKDGIDVSDEVISLAPNKDIFYNEDTKKWYKEKTFETEIDTSKLQKKMNYHAHISFTKWDELTGKNIRLQKSDLQKIQTITAREMKMERGEENSQAKRLNHYQIKKLQSEANEQKLDNRELKLVTVPQLKAEIAILRAELKENKATRADYAELEQLNKELKAKVESKDLTIQELKGHKKALIASISGVLKREQREELSKLEPLEQFTKAGEFVKENILGFKNQAISALERTKPLQAENETLKERLSVLKQDMSVLSTSLINSQREVNELEQILPEEKRSIFTPLKVRFKGFLQELKETIKAQATEILSLKNQNQELRKENQEYKALVSEQVKSLVPDGDELMAIDRTLKDDLPVARDIFEVLGDIEEIDKKARASASAGLKV